MTKSVEAKVRSLGVAATCLAALFWFGASIIRVPDNIDTFIQALQAIGRLNAYAATAACVAAVCGLVLYLKDKQPT